MTLEQPSAQGDLIQIAVLDDDPDFLTYIEDFLLDEKIYAVRTFEKPDRLWRRARIGGPISYCWI